MSDLDSESSSEGDYIESEDQKDYEEETFRCPFCTNDALSTVQEVFDHSLLEHDYNFEKQVVELGKSGDELSLIRLVNYLRLNGLGNVNPAVKLLPITHASLEDDKLLIPVLEDDALLHSLGDYITSGPDQEDEKLTDYRQYEDFVASRLQGVDIEEKAGERDKSYFDSYKAAGIHREMISDTVRTEGYQNFIEKYAHLFKGKTVLDVGCGTGILSLFCARAGASKVYAVDNSDIAIKAKMIVAANKYDHIVEVIQGRVEEKEVRRRIGDKSVDIIISEWMGYGLLFEGMLDSVLVARDMYLKPGGLMYPSHMTLLIAPVTDSEWIAEQTGETFWKDVYGFDFSAMNPSTALNAKDIAVLDVPLKSIPGTPSTFKVLDIGQITVQELDFTAPFSCEIFGQQGEERLHAWTIWFDTYFLSPGNSISELMSIADRHLGRGLIDEVQIEKLGAIGTGFSTGPVYLTEQHMTTHWHQAVLLVDEEKRGKVFTKGETLTGTVCYKKTSRDVRGIDVEIAWAQGGGEERRILRTID